MSPLGFAACQSKKCTNQARNGLNEFLLLRIFNNGLIGFLLLEIFNNGLNGLNGFVGCVISTTD